jgi:hypothetical protein
MRDRAALEEGRTALKRIGPGWRFERAKPAGPKPKFGGRRVERLVDQGYLRWVNACRSATVLTDEGDIYKRMFKLLIQFFGILCRGILMRHSLGALTCTVLLTLATVTPALACRHYSIWSFPWPQRCSVSTPVHAAPVTLTSPIRDTDMPLPDLTPVDGGGPDENTRARLLLRAALAR